MAGPILGNGIFQDSTKTNHTHTLSLSLRVANHFLPSFLSWLAPANELEGACQGVCPTYRVTHPLPPQPSCTWDQPTSLGMSTDSAKLDIRKPGACPTSATQTALWACLRHNHPGLSA